MPGVFLISERQRFIALWLKYKVLYRLYTLKVEFKLNLQTKLIVMNENEPVKYEVLSHKLLTHHESP